MKKAPKKIRLTKKRLERYQRLGAQALKNVEEVIRSGVLKPPPKKR